jgi:hypothetical protein
MSEIQLTHFSFGAVAPDRDRFHDVAVREARMTTDRIETTRQAAPVRSFAARLRLALAAGPAVTTEACNCPA